MSEKPTHHQNCPWQPPREPAADEPLLVGPACSCDDSWARDLGYELGAGPNAKPHAEFAARLRAEVGPDPDLEAFREAASAAMSREAGLWSEVELRRELAAWQASYAMLNDELTATRNARDLAVEAFEGVNMKLAEARRMLANAPRITDNGRGVPTYYLWEPNGTRVQLVTLGLVETLVKLSQGISGTPVEQEPPNGTVVVDAAHIAWQRRDADAFAAPEDCWFQVGQEDGDPWTSVLAAGPAVVVWRPRPIEYDHARVTVSPSTARFVCADCGTSADTAEELATVPCETGEVRAARIESILEETQASQSEAVERLRTEDEGDQ